MPIIDDKTLTEELRNALFALNTASRHLIGTPVQEQVLVAFDRLHAILMRIDGVASPPHAAGQPPGAAVTVRTPRVP